jgi:glycosyltransferase involved in cell wall biosynthesis
MYVGNLEKYQGIDLLLAGFSHAVRAGCDVELVVAGGTDSDIEKYRKTAASSGLEKRVHFLGRWPAAQLDELLAEADILTAPRTTGINTPQKIFPYMHSGRVVLLTDLPTHSQIVDSNVCFLAEPTPEAFGEAISTLSADPGLRRRLGAAGRAFVEGDHTFEAHQRRIDELYDGLIPDQPGILPTQKPA